MYSRILQLVHSRSDSNTIEFASGEFITQFIRGSGHCFVYYARTYHKSCPEVELGRVVSQGEPMRFVSEDPLTLLKGFGPTERFVGDEAVLAKLEELEKQLTQASLEMAKLNLAKLQAIEEWAESPSNITLKKVGNT